VTGIAIKKQATQHAAAALPIDLLLLLLVLHDILRLVVLSSRTQVLIDW
jgi:hypothetical protein